MTAIQAELLSYLPFKRKQTSSGWMSFDAPCCVHNGETTDTRPLAMGLDLHITVSIAAIRLVGNLADK